MPINPAVAQIQQELVEIRMNLLQVLQNIAGDREATGKTATAQDQLEIWRAKEALALARIDLAKMDEEG